MSSPCNGVERDVAQAMVVADGGGAGVRGRARRMRHDQRLLVLLDAVDAEFVAFVGFVRQPRIVGQSWLIWQPGRPWQHQPVVRTRRFLGESVVEQWQPRWLRQLRRFAVDLLVPRAGQRSWGRRAGAATLADAANRILE